MKDRLMGISDVPRFYTFKIIARRETYPPPRGFTIQPVVLTYRLPEEATQGLSRANLAMKSSAEHVKLESHALVSKITSLWDTFGK